VATAEVGIRGKLRTGDVGHALSATANTFTLKLRNADALVDTLSFVQDRLLLTVGGWLSGVGVPGVGCAAHIDRVGDAGLLTGRQGRSRSCPRSDHCRCSCRCNRLSRFHHPVRPE
jgi:hypothetical protein